jgi:hypothetical protein
MIVKDPEGMDKRMKKKKSQRACRREDFFPRRT